MFAAVVLASAVFTFASCYGGSVEELLSPPRLGDEQSEIYEALRSVTNGDITLKYPKSGQYRSAFVIKDLDDEPTDEAIVFYELPNISDGASLRMSFLDKQEGKWVCVYDLSASGSEVESVSFADLGDGRTSVMVTYLVRNSGDRATSVMQYRGSEPVELFNGRHSFIDVFDANSDGKDEMFLIGVDRGPGPAIAYMYGFSGENFMLLGASPLSGRFAEYRKLSCGPFDETGKNAVFIDYTMSDGSSGTDMIVYSRNRLSLSPAVNATTISRYSNTYTPALYCSDIDGDGLTEIPSCAPMQGYSELSAQEQVNYQIWYSVSNNGAVIKEKCRTFTGTKGDYMLLLPEEWYRDITASCSVSVSSVSFGVYGAGEEQPESSLLRIYGAAEGSAEKYENSEYISLGKSPATGYSYFAQLTGDCELSITEEQLFKMFTFTGGQTKND